MLLDFDKYTYDNTEEFSLDNYLTDTRVVDIYDGDTCTCIIPIFNKYYKYHVRLNGIDTAELKSKDKLYIKKALDARKRLFELVTQNKIKIDEDISKLDLRKLLNEKCYIIKLKCGKFDKYGRLLGYLFDKKSKCLNINESYNYCLVDENLAYKYDGGTKNI